MGSLSPRFILFASLSVPFLFFIFTYSTPSQKFSLESFEEWTHNKPVAVSSAAENAITTVTATVTVSPSPTGPPANPYSDLSPEDLERDYSRTLVIAALETEDIAWLNEELSEHLEPAGSLKLAKYVVDNNDSPLHPPVNKGHEGMVYLSYIIQHYERLPDVSIFMHSHSYTWHNNDILFQSSAELVRRLNLGKVVREGYMNLRCHWGPGCPARMHLNDLEEDINKKEQREMAKAFQEIFPGDSVPDVLAQPCCAQFAVSREFILSRTKEKYMAVRDWLIHTELEDEISGRVLEYLWQYLFTNLPTHCPDTNLCYCDGFKVCFPSVNDYVQYTDLQDASNALQEELDRWREQRDRYEGLLEDVAEDDRGDPPEEGREEQLQSRIDGLTAELDRRREVAFDTGNNPERRLEVLSEIFEDLVRNPRSFNNPLGSE